MIRNGFYTIYKEKTYQLITDGSSSQNKYFLKSLDKSDIKNGFTLIKEPDYPTFIEIFGKKIQTAPKRSFDIFFKEVTKLDALEVYRINTFGIYHGHEFPIEGENETQYFLRADSWEDWIEKLGFIRRDRDDIIKDVDKADVDPVYERKTPLPDFFD